MSGRLSNSAGHWRIHAAATAVSLSVVLWLLAGRTWFPCGRTSWLLLPGGLHLAAALLHRGYARAAYRGGMRFGGMAGAVMSAVILALLFLTIVTPLALLMKLTGRDPLSRRPKPGQQSNFHPAPPFTGTDRMF